MEIAQTTPPTDVTRRRHDTDPSEGDTGEPGGEPAHHARRPMNAFLIFCKRHRSVVRDKYPSLENRSITKILGEWWANLEKEEKASYTGLAKQYKDAFFNANPDFKWYKLPAPPLRTLTRPGTDNSPSKLEDAFVNERKNNNSTQIDFNRNQNVTNISPSDDSNQSSMITPGKLANEAHMGAGLTSLMHHFDKSSKRGVIPVTNNRTFDYRDDKQMSPTSAVKTHPCETFIPVRGEMYSIRVESDNQNNHVNEIAQGSKVRMKTKDMTSESNIKLQDELSETTRIFEKTFDTSVGVAISHNLIKRDTNINNNYPGIGLHEADRNSNFTPQQLINQVVDEKLSTKEYTAECQESFNEVTSSDGSYGPNIATSASTKECDNQFRWGRACKGKRYQEFMSFGGLKVNKRQRRDYGDYSFDEDYSDHQIEHNASSTWTEASGCSGDTDVMNRETANDSGHIYAKTYYDVEDVLHQNFESTEHVSEQSFADSNGNKSMVMFKASDFNLDDKIRALPSLSLEKFQQKKRDNKKRKRTISIKSKDYRPKFISKTARRPSDGSESSCNSSYSLPVRETQFNHTQVERNVVHQTTSTTSPGEKTSKELQIAEQWREAIIGSQKRKPRKISITRLAINSTVDKTDSNHGISNNGKDSVTHIAEDCSKPITKPVSQPESQPQLDLFALATLAEIASNTSKLDESK